MQVDKLVYFALLLKRCLSKRDPRPDEMIVRIFTEKLNSYRNSHGLEEGYEQNARSIQYIIIMAQELEILFGNNKMTPWGTTLEFLTPEEIPIDLPMEFRIFFLKCFLLENYAFIRSLSDHLQKFGEMIDDFSWYKETKTPVREGLTNHAFSVYIHSLRTAYSSVNSIGLQRRYLRLYRRAMKTGKTAKALLPKLKPSLGLMEDLGLLKMRKTNNSRISFSDYGGHKPCLEILKRFPDYKTLSREENVIPILLEAYGCSGKKTLSDQELLHEMEDLYIHISDPIFNVCDIDTLINVTTLQKNLQGYALRESEIRQVIIDASKKDRRKYQILSDRQGKNRFLKIAKDLVS
jgi:hypothetical protein